MRGWGTRKGFRGRKWKHFEESYQVPTSDEIPLIMASPGSTVEVTRINAGVGLWERLMGMGIRPGIRLYILTNDFRGLIVAVNSSRYALGRGMAEKIYVRPVN